MEGKSALELRLDLSKHCIETEIKKHYHRALSSYFRAGADKALIEETLTLTQQALAHLDFGFLRNRYSPLAGHSNASVTLTRHEDRLVVCIDGQPIGVRRKKPCQVIV